MVRNKILKKFSRMECDVMNYDNEVFSNRNGFEIMDLD